MRVCRCVRHEYPSLQCTIALARPPLVRQRCTADCSYSLARSHKSTKSGDGQRASVPVLFKSERRLCRILTQMRFCASPRPHKRILAALYLPTHAAGATQRRDPSWGANLGASGSTSGEFAGAGRGRGRRDRRASERCRSRREAQQPELAHLLARAVCWAGLR